MEQAVNGGPRRADRRAAIRFDIQQDVRYKLLNRGHDETGSGRTVNISSRGVLFTTERHLRAGERLEISVNWPARLDNRCPLKLVATGKVVRSQQGLAAISIERYEFRTQGLARFGQGQSGSNGTC